MITIKKEALEKAIQEMVTGVKDAADWFDEQKITIECGDGYEVQIVVTNDEENFIGEEYTPYKEAN